VHAERSSTPSVPRPAILGWLVGVELVCLAGFTGFLLVGQADLGFALLVVPVQIVVLGVLARDSYMLLVFLAALLPLAGLELLPHVYQRFILYPGIVLLLGFFRLSRFVEGETRIRVGLAKSERIAFLLLAISVVAAAANATLHGWGSKHLVVFTIFALEVLAVAYFFAVVPRTLQQVSRLFYIVAATLLLTVIIMTVLPDAVGEGGTLGGKVIVTPFGIANLNAFATVLAGVTAVLIGLALEERRFGVRLALAVLIVLFVAALLFTRSRGAWLGFGIAFLYIVLRVRSFRLTAIVAAGVLVLLSLESFRHVLFTRIGETSMNDPSLTGRFVLWYYAWKVASANWLFGVGMENFKVVKQFYGFPAPMSIGVGYNAHNIFLEFLADLGVVGLVGLLWAIVGAVARLDSLTRSRRAEGWGLAIGLTAGIIAYAVHGLLDALTWQHGAFMLLGMLLGLALCVRRLTSTPKATPQHDSASLYASG